MNQSLKTIALLILLLFATSANKMEAAGGIGGELIFGITPPLYNPDLQQSRSSNDNMRTKGTGGQSEVIGSILDSPAPSLSKKKSENKLLELQSAISSSRSGHSGTDPNTVHGNSSTNLPKAGDIAANSDGGQRVSDREAQEEEVIPVSREYGSLNSRLNALSPSGDGNGNDATSPSLENINSEEAKLVTKINALPEPGNNKVTGPGINKEQQKIAIEKDEGQLSLKIKEARIKKLQKEIGELEELQKLNKDNVEAAETINDLERRKEELKTTKEEKKKLENEIASDISNNEDKPLSTAQMAGYIFWFGVPIAILGYLAYVIPPIRNVGKQLVAFIKRSLGG